MSNVNYECSNQNLLSNQVLSVLSAQYNNVIDTVGFNVDIYFPVNELNQFEDIYNENPAIRFQGPYKTRVFVDWSPNIRQLKNFGIFTEEEAPIVIWLKNRDDLPKITTRSLVKITMSYTGGVESDEWFELNTEIIRNMYNKAVVSSWTMSPFRGNIRTTEFINP